MPECRLCDARLGTGVLDLGATPLANSYLTERDLQSPEVSYPLCLFVCDECHLVQIGVNELPAKIFDEYLYFSSYSDVWQRHCAHYAERMTEACGLGPDSLVVEVASNDGCLLQYFRKKGIRVHGVEPAGNVARVAADNGIPTRVCFFGEGAARALRNDLGGGADLIAANNVLAHVPDINDFAAGFQHLLAPGGLLTLEFPHLLNLIVYRQFDTIYHEHVSYLSLLVVERLLSEHGLRVFDVEEIPTHGGSLRVYAGHAQDSSRAVSRDVGDILEKERRAGLDGTEVYGPFRDAVLAIKSDLLEFLITACREGKTVVGYGAPAKGNTLLNYCGIGPEYIPYTVDLSPHKQGRYLPGSRIPIHSPDRIMDTKPEYVLILPWNIRDEVAAQMAGIRDWGGEFVTTVPRLDRF